MKLRNKLIYLLEKLLKVNYPQLVGMTKEQEIGLFSELYSNPTFRKYLDAREDYLIKRNAERFLSGNIPDANTFAGQIFEVRELRNRAKSSYIHMQNIVKQKDSANKKVAQDTK